MSPASRSVNASDADPALHELLSSVAEAVHLQEGEVGVARVLRAIHALAPAPIRALSRRVGLPVPVVAAINNELRARGAVTGDRPSRLTPAGEDMVRRLGSAAADATCPTCSGHGLVIGDELRPVVEELAAITAGMPAIDRSLDQSHATAETKVRRVLAAMHHQALPASGMLLVGDDDLVSLATLAVGAAMGVRLVERLAVVELSDDVLGTIAAAAARWDGAPELVRHDLRDPLPDHLRGAFDVAMTDPPYTPEGARLFLSRAVEGLRPGPGRTVLFSFGPKGPDEGLQVQRSMLEMGLTVAAMHRNFNEYLGAGILASSSNLSILATSPSSRAVVDGVHSGSLYTSDKRGRGRNYLCLSCGARHLVGPGTQWATHSDLKAAGCPRCGGRRFRPLQLEPAAGAGEERTR